MSPGPLARAAEILGAETVKNVIVETLSPFRRAGGSYDLKATYNVVIGTK